MAAKVPKVQHVIYGISFTQVMVITAKRLRKRSGLWISCWCNRCDSTHLDTNLDRSEPTPPSGKAAPWAIASKAWCICWSCHSLIFQLGIIRIQYTSRWQTLPSWQSWLQKSSPVLQGSASQGAICAVSPTSVRCMTQSFSASMFSSGNLWHLNMPW